MKKLVSLLLVLMMAISLTAVSASAENYDQVTFAFMTMNALPTEEGLTTVQEAINVIAREKIGVEVTLKVIGLADYSSSVSRSLQGGEKIDVFETVFNFANCVSMEMGYDITDLIQEYGTGIMEVMSEDILDVAKVDGRLYAVPVNRPLANSGYFLCRQDILEALDIDISNVLTPDDLTPVFEKVKAAYPDMTMIAPLGTGQLGLELSIPEIDYLSDSDRSCFGALIGDSLTVENLYESDAFIHNVKLARQWYEAGYILKDAATTIMTQVELMTGGNCFGVFTAHGLPADELAGMMSVMYGYPIAAIKVGDPYIVTSSANIVTTMIASNTNVPEASMKFVNLMYTDADVMNLLICGIEDRDYVMTEDGYVAYPEGQTDATVPYTAQMENATLGNYFLIKPIVGTSKSSIEFALEQNKTAKRSPAFGFNFDPTRVSSAYTAVSNVANQYLPGLICGSVDPETELPRFVQALKDAGLQRIIDAKQDQLDKWLKTK